MQTYIFNISFGGKSEEIRSNVASQKALYFGVNSANYAAAPMDCVVPVL